METNEIGAAYIGGTWRNIRGDRVLPVLDPATEYGAGSIRSSGSCDVQDAVHAASDARDVWGAASTQARLNALDALIAGIEARREVFAETISAEIGSPIDFSRSAQVGAALAHLQATYSAVSGLSNDVPIAERPEHRVRYEPIGVAGLITPWNWPLNQVVLKVGAALSAGCPMVLKPSEYATRTAVLFTEVMAEIGLPSGVFNMLPGDGDTGAELVAHPAVDVVSFTGSTRAGADIAARAARRFARTTLELGGKSPNLLFEDCDLETAMRQGLAHCFRNAGQSCNAASRMLVQRSIYEQAVGLAAEIAGSTLLGLPSDSGPHLGPLVNAAQFARVRELIAHGEVSNLRRVAGGAERPDAFPRGYFVRPTVFADVPPENRLFQEEIFGPVLTMTPFDTEDEAVALANNTSYGLAAYVQTGDPSRADRVSRRLNAGMVQVNGTSRAQGAPFGGRKASGYGREAGLWGIRSFQDIKSISGAPRVD